MVHHSVGLSDRQVLGKAVVQSDLVTEIGVRAERDVVDADGLERVFAVLREPLVEELENWSRRFKANGEKISSGDVFRVAEVVRDLARRDAGRGVSPGEKRMLVKARHILASELALANKIAEEQAEVLIDEVLAS